MAIQSIHSKWAEAAKARFKRELHARNYSGSITEVINMPSLVMTPEGNWAIWPTSKAVANLQQMPSEQTKEFIRWGNFDDPDSEDQFQITLRRHDHASNSSFPSRWIGERIFWIEKSEEWDSAPLPNGAAKKLAIEYKVIIP